MKTKKLVRKIKELLSADQREQIAKADSLEKILEKLDKKEAALREKLAGERHEARRKEIRRKLEVLAAQREKGEKLSKKIEPLRETA